MRKNERVRKRNLSSLSGLPVSEKLFSIVIALWNSVWVLSYLEKPLLCCERAGLLVFSNFNVYFKNFHFPRNSQGYECR